jgi:hypothetical protein
MKDNSNTKIYFCYKSTQKSPVENNKDPIFILINDFDSVKELLNNKNEDKMFLFLYFNKEKIHNILYDLEEVIKINEDLYLLFSNNNICGLFYFDMLLLDNPESINYIYSIKIIRNLNHLKNDLSKYKKVILSKLIINLIYNFKGTDEYNEEKYLNELNEIENENSDIIKVNIEVFKEFNCNYDYNDIINSKIDTIYMNIIISLIKLNKFNDYNYYEEILIQLNLESIYITNTIYEGLSKELDVTKNDFLNEYMINDVNNLKNEKIINFYYIIIVKVLKNSIYICKNQFLDENRKELIKLIKYKKDIIINLEIGSDLRDKIKSILKIIYNDYFYEKYLNVPKIKTPEKKNEESFIIIDSQYNADDFDKSQINKYSQSNMNDEFKEDKKVNDEKGFISEEKEPIETEDIRNKTKISYENAVQILNFLKLIISIVQKEDGGPQIKNEKFFYGKERIEIERKDLYENGNYEELTEEDKKNKDASIVYKNYKKLLLFIKEIEDCINNSEIKFNPRIEIDLEKQNDSPINASGDHKDYYDILCTSKFKNQLDNDKILEFIDRNILVNGLEGKCNGFSFLINELSNDDYENETFKYND